MKKGLITIIFLSTFIFGVSAAFADNIGYVDLQKVFLSSNEAKKAQDDFKLKQEAYQKEFDDKQKEIEKAKTDNKPEEDIKKMIAKFEKELEPKKDELVKLNQELVTTLKAKILTASEKVAKEYGIDVVLDKQVILIGGFDMTDFVVKKLNSK
jgi:outer membrane protein